MYQSSLNACALNGLKKEEMLYIRSVKIVTYEDAQITSVRRLDVIPVKSITADVTDDLDWICVGFSVALETALQFILETTLGCGIVGFGRQFAVVLILQIYNWICLCVCWCMSVF